jgi:hypothetical protein
MFYLAPFSQDELVKFKSKYGHCNVPKHYEDNPQLGMWVGLQRQELKKYINGEPFPLDGTTQQERINKLNRIHFTWNGVDALNNKKWGIMFVSLYYQIVLSLSISAIHSYSLISSDRII